ncbi:MAG: hypothetical protein ACSLEN_07950 [Candidatus Malihini olakiniferum]
MRILNLERDKICLFYNWNISNSLLKKVYLDAYRQNIKREFRNDLVQSSVDYSYQGWAMTDAVMTLKTDTNDKQVSDGITVQTDLPPWDNHLLIVDGQWSRDDVKQTASTNVNIGKTISFFGSSYNININPNINF